MADKMVEKIRLLLAKAEAFGVTAAEAEAYTAKAAALMAKHGVEQHMITAAEQAARPVEPTNQTRTITPPFPHQKKDMLVWVGDAMRLHPVVHRDLPPAELAGKYRRVLRVELFGAPADIDRCLMLFDSLLAQATRLIRDELPPGAGSAYKQSWLNGFAARVSGRVAEEEQQAARRYDSEHVLTGTAKSAELVLVAWDEKVVSFRDSLYPSLGVAKARRSSGNGYHAGWQAGSRAALGQRALTA